MRDVSGTNYLVRPRKVPYCLSPLFRDSQVHLVITNQRNKIVKELTCVIERKTTQHNNLCITKF